MTRKLPAKELPFVAIRIEPEIQQAMKQCKEETGVALQFQANAALKSYLRKKGFYPPKPYAESR